MNYRNITDLNNIILQKIHLIPNDVDLVLGVARSGLIPAILISLYKNIPYQELDSFLLKNDFNGGFRLQRDKPQNKVNKILVIDDSLCSGREMSICKEKLKDLEKSYNFLYSVIFIVPENKNLVDIYFEELRLPRVFQWNIFHHIWITEACVDIDGVLCIDPTEEENDDGEKYEHFILNAKALYIPTVTIDTIVSCRLEKYRSQTESWLRDNNVKYNKLILLDLPDKESRQRWGKYGEYKANVYLNSNNSLFIESSIKQAYDIAKISQKPVFCTENFQMITPENKRRSTLSKYIGKIKTRIKRYLK